jgi:hypothetical protein
MVDRLTDARERPRSTPIQRAKLYLGLGRPGDQPRPAFEWDWRGFFAFLAGMGVVALAARVIWGGDLEHWQSILVLAVEIGAGQQAERWYLRRRRRRFSRR